MNEMRNQQINLKQDTSILHRSIKFDKIFLKIAQKPKWFILQKAFKTLVNKQKMLIDSIESWVQNFYDFEG